MNNIGFNTQTAGINNIANNNNFNLANNQKAIYAEKGDVIYQKEMDSDDDGIITIDEFVAYCKENNIPPSQQQQMLQNRLNLQFHKDRTRVSNEIRKIDSGKNAVYAKEGDENYEKEMDENQDGKITYDEYMRYGKEQEEAQENKQSEKAVVEKTEESADEEEKFVIKNPGKAANIYAENDSEKSESKIEKEA